MRRPASQPAIAAFCRWMVRLQQAGPLRWRQMTGHIGWLLVTQPAQVLRAACCGKLKGRTETVERMAKLLADRGDVRGKSPEAPCRGASANLCRVVAELFALWQKTLPRSPAIEAG